jgi:predicted RNA methylase
MAAKRRTLSEATRKVLGSLTCDRNMARIALQLDRDLHTQTDAVLRGLGAKWNRSAQAHVFPEGVDARKKIADLLASDGYSTPQDHGFFPTPRKVIEEYIAEHWRGPLAGTGEVLRALEPSAGHGAIADWLAARLGIDNVVCVELLDDNVSVLEKKGYAVAVGDFLAMTPDTLGLFDRVVMNPPFRGLADIDHVMHAWKFLKPGGQLMSVMSKSVTFRRDGKAASFRRFVEEHRGWIDDLPEYAFLESGTQVSAVFLELDKPGDAKPLPDPWPVRVEVGDVIAATGGRFAVVKVTRTPTGGVKHVEAAPLGGVGSYRFPPSEIQFVEPGAAPPRVEPPPATFDRLPVEPTAYRQAVLL